jgi:hypothetical protein
MAYNGISKIIVSDTEGLKAALCEVAALRETGVKQPLTIALHGGEYCLGETIVIDEGVSAVTIEPCGGETAVISGGRRITGFS